MSTCLPTFCQSNACLQRSAIWFARCRARQAQALRNCGFCIASVRGFTHSGFQLARQPGYKGSRIPWPRQPPPSRASKSPPPPPRPYVSPPPPKKPISPPRAKRYSETLFEDGNNHVLLYEAPNHRSFNITAWVIGSTFILGSYNWTQLDMGQGRGQADDTKPQPPPIYIRLLLVVPRLFLTVIGTAIILSTCRQVKTISVAAPFAETATGRVFGPSPTLRCEVKAFVPFVKSMYLERALEEIHVDFKIRADKVLYTSIPFENRAAFTEQYFTPSKSREQDPNEPEMSTRDQQSKPGVLAMLKMNVRRMLIRDGFASMQIAGAGEFRLDVQHCLLLDSGKPLKELTRRYDATAQGAWRTIRRNLLA